LNLNAASNWNEPKNNDDDDDCEADVIEFKEGVTERVVSFNPEQTAKLKNSHTNTDIGSIPMTISVYARRFGS
jgi:hypothetical protein